MGKCGVQEFNYIFDVDVMYVVELVNDDVLGVSVVIIVIKLVVLVVRMCLVYLGVGLIWQVDVVLCLEGNVGLLVCIMDLMCMYYEKWVKNWEF